MKFKNLRKFIAKTEDTAEILHYTALRVCLLVNNWKHIAQFAYTAPKLSVQKQIVSHHLCKQNFHSSLQNVNLMLENKIPVAKQIACI